MAYMSIRQPVLLSAFLMVSSLLSPCWGQTPFDLARWKSEAGSKKSLKEWGKENPSPWRSYFSSDSADCAKRWYVNLGPLGVRTLMHDRSWGAFKSCRGIFPKALTDDDGLIWNAFEVVGVKAGAPAEGRLQVGDLILGMDRTALKSAQHTFVGQPLSNRTKRGLEIHAGQLLDQAEGRGRVSLIVLRFPEDVKSQPLSGQRTWKTVAKQSSGDALTMKLSVPLGKASLCRVRPKASRAVKTDALTLVGQDGRRLPVEIATKRGAGKLIGDILEIPDGQWTLQGDLESSRVFELEIDTCVTPPLPASFRPYLKMVSLELDQIGAFGSHFSPEGVKARNYAAMLAHRLAIQQEKDGSWDAGGYASDAFHSSICGLALLSTGDPAYADAIRRAANYVAFHGERDKWTYSNGLWSIFLAEYYLRTGDREILPALRMNVRNLRRFVLSDYTAGHSFARPGYGGSGWIGGGGVVSCGLAVASHTPAVDAGDLALLDRMLARGQELAPHGRIQYGRGGKVKSHDAAPGQGGSCSTGPYFIASLIRGGAPLFVRNASKRYSLPPFGDAENGHATQTLHFFWGCLAVANADPHSHLDNMSAYLWKFTTLREFDGFINKNNYRTEYHNGDGVIGEPYWRTAGYLVLMNAHKRNLAITGNPKFRGQLRDVPVVYHRDRAAHNQALRNWELVRAVLADKAPRTLLDALERLRALPEGPGLSTALRDMLRDEAPRVAASLVALPRSPAGIDKAQLAQLVLGHAFQASFSPAVDLSAEDDLGAGADEEADGAKSSLSKKEQKLAAKELQKRIDKGLVDSVAHKLHIEAVSLLQADPEALAGAMDLKGALFPVRNLRIEAVDPNRSLLASPVSSRPGETTLTTVREFKLKGKGELRVNVSYESAGVKIAYTAPLALPAHESRGYVPFLTQVPVTGSVIDDYSLSYSMRILLDHGQAIGCEQHGDPINYLLAGGKYAFRISPNSGGWGHDLRAAKALTPEFRVAAIKSMDGGGNLRSVTDADSETHIAITKPSEFIFTLQQPNQVSSVYMDLRTSSWRQSPSHELYAEVDGKWVLLRTGSMTGLMPTIPATTRRLRLRFTSKTAVNLHTLRFITPAADSAYAGLFSW